MGAFIPADAEWYVADLVEEIRVEGDPRSVVHINTVLVNARSPDEAFSRAWELGEESEHEYLNPSNQRVTCKFRGLRDLNVIHDPLEHGAEIFYSERVGLGESEIESLVRDRGNLAVFRDIEPSDGPDYRCGTVMEEAMEIVRQMHRT